MPYSFGRDITYSFYPIKDEQLGDSFENLAYLTDSPSIYIFDEHPDRTVAAAGTGAVATISSWSNTDDGKGKSFTIPAIDDPEPTGSKTDYSYYIAVNFTLQDTEQIQTVVRLLPMRRVIGHASTAEPTLQDISDIYPDYQAFFGDHVTERAIKTAVIQTKTKLKANGYKFCTIWNPDELKLCIAYKALSELALKDISSSGVWETRYEAWRDTAESMLKDIELLIDIDVDGEPDKKESLPNSIVLSR